MEVIPASQINEDINWIELLLLEEMPRQEVVVYIDEVKYATFNDLQLKIPIRENQKISVSVEGIPGIFSIQIIDFSDRNNIEYFPGKVMEVSENSPLEIVF